MAMNETFGVMLVEDHNGQRFVLGPGTRDLLERKAAALAIHRGNLKGYFFGETAMLRAHEGMCQIFVETKGER
jgi:hypothetical protein